MERNKIAALLAVSMMLLCAMAYTGTSDAEAGTCSILIDRGNGDTYWSDVPLSGVTTLGDAFTKAATDAGIQYEFDGTKVTVDGLSERTVGTGSGSGSYIESGTTSVTVSSSWKLFSWNGTVWNECPIADLSSAIDLGGYALGFYPENFVPIETPDHRSSWTMIRGDSEQNGNQTTEMNGTEPAEFKWTAKSDVSGGVCSSPLSAGGLVFLKFNTSAGMSAGETSSVICYTFDGTEKWRFEFPGISLFETSTPVIAGDSMFIPTGYGGYGNIFKLPWRTGPGTDNCDVTMLGGIPYDEEKVKAGTDSIPYNTGAELTGKEYNTGLGSLVFDSGCIYCMASNGMVYCLSSDLDLIWSSQMNGHTYYISPTVAGGYVFAGTYSGWMYINDQCTGALIASKNVISSKYHEKDFGYVGAISAIKNGTTFKLYASANDGRGMDVRAGGLMTAEFDGTNITSCSVDKETFGLLSNYITHAKTGSFEGVYFTASKGFYRMNLLGNYECLCTELEEIHAAPVLVNNERFYLTSYTAGKPNYILDMDGKIVGAMSPPSNVRNYSMAPLLVIDGYVIAGNDDGGYCIYGEFPEYVGPAGAGSNFNWQPFAVAAGSILIILAAVYCGLRFIGKKEHPFAFIGESVRHFFSGSDYSHNRRNKHRLFGVLVAGLILTVIVFFVSLSYGSGGNMSFTDSLAALVSAIGKGGNNLNYEETLVYESRFPRTLAAVAVGIGLSIAGSVYQAIIRNPLVDPYIMGVSSGAGTAAIAVIAFDFTFFGLFPLHSPYLVAITAMIGGMIAFLCTMLIAEKAGGSSVNYVLAGVVVGLAFSAVQTIMMSMAGNKVSNVLSWLFGSFSNVSWEQLWVIVIPAVILSLIPLIWAKEFNLILLGEDQAKLMGLNVRAFTIGMLTLASVLASVCVAFVGVIGFVGLVIPHLCRMILGGDHRLVMPTSIVMGALMMMLADFVSRMLIYGQELPVGAITTIIGVPVFAWLLIRKGRIYNG